MTPAATGSASRAGLAGLAPAQLLRAAARHRVLLSAGLAALAVAVGIGAVTPAAAAQVGVLAAAHDLPSGAVLTETDLVVLELPAGTAPAGVLVDPQAAVDRVVAGPVRQGEPLTDVRLVGASLIRSGSNLVAAPLRVADPATGALVRAGDRVDVLAAAPEGAPFARRVAEALEVLAVPALADDTGEGALLVVAATPSAAARLASAAASSRLSVTVRAR